MLPLLVAKKLPDGSKASGNPLWLTLALEQLNLLDADDFGRAEREFHGTAEERLRAMVLDTVERMPPSVAELYGWLLAQNERIFGPSHVRAFAAMIALGRVGWRESDLLELMPRVAGLVAPGESDEGLDDLKLAALRRGFRAHLVRRGTSGLLDFFHAQMRRAVEARSLGDPEVIRAIHGVIADHLEALPAENPLRATEVMVHLVGYGDAERAARCYASQSSDSSLASATQVLALHIVQGRKNMSNPHLDWTRSFLDQPGLAEVQVQNLANQFNYDLNNALGNIADLSTRRTLLESARQALARLSASDPSNLDCRRDLSVSQERIGDLLQAQGDLEGALREYRASLEVSGSLSDADPSDLGSRRDVSVSHDRIGDVLQEQGDLTGALRAYRAGLRARQRLAASATSHMAWQRGLSVSHSKLGDILLTQGNLSGALREYRTNMKICERLSALDPSNDVWQRDRSISHTKLGDVLRSRGELPGALREYGVGLQVSESLSAGDPANLERQRDLSIIREKLGDVLQEQDVAVLHL